MTNERIWTVGFILVLAVLAIIIGADAAGRAQARHDLADSAVGAHECAYYGHCD